jgi:hypothetical protein
MEMVLLSFQSIQLLERIHNITLFLISQIRNSHLGILVREREGWQFGFGVFYVELAF